MASTRNVVVHACPCTSSPKATDHAGDEGERCEGPRGQAGVYAHSHACLGALAVTVRND